MIKLDMSNKYNLINIIIYTVMSCGLPTNSTGSVPKPHGLPINKSGSVLRPLGHWIHPGQDSATFWVMYDHRIM